MCNKLIRWKTDEVDLPPFFHTSQLTKRWEISTEKNSWDILSATFRRAYHILSIPSHVTQSWNSEFVGGKCYKWEFDL